MEAILGDIKEILITYKYPLIDSMNKEEFFNIFQRSNRYSLLSWMMNQLDTCFGDLLQGDQNKTIVEEYLYDFGFCLRDESLHFIKGMLDPLRELEIIYNILRFIKKVKSLPPITDNYDVTAINDIEALEVKDLNLFPMLGEIKIAEGICEKPNINEECDHSTFSDQFSSVATYAEISKLIKSLSDSIPKIKRLCDSPKEPTHLPILDAQVVLKCSQNMKIISQYLQDLCTVNDTLTLEDSGYEEQISLKDLRSSFETLLNYVTNSLEDDY